MEALRQALERDLGPDRFLAAYRHLRLMQDRLSANEDAGTGGVEQAVLEKLLCQKNLHLARQVLRLITLEDSVFK